MAVAVGAIIVFSVLAGLCAFLIECDESMHRFSRSQSIRRGCTSGLTAALFFAVIGAVVMVVVTR